MAVKTGQKTFNMNLKVSGDNVEKVEALIADHAVFMRENHSLDDAKIQLNIIMWLNRTNIITLLILLREPQEMCFIPSMRFTPLLKGSVNIWRPL